MARADSFLVLQALGLNMLQLDLELARGDVAAIRLDSRAVADEFVDILCGRCAPRSGHVEIGGLPPTCWPDADLHRQLRVLRPRLCLLPAASVADRSVAPIAAIAPSGSWDELLVRVPTTRCVVVDGLLDGLPPAMLAEAMRELDACAARHGIAVLVLAVETVSGVVASSAAGSARQ